MKAEIYHKEDGSYAVKVEGKVVSHETFWKFAEAEAYVESEYPNAEITYIGASDG